MKDLPTRKRIRLKGYDYSQEGAYFITICTQNKYNLFGYVHVGANSVRPHLSDVGEIVKTAIEKISQVYTLVHVESYVIMPNHIHMILIVHNSSERTLCAPTVSRVVKQMKEYVTKQIGYCVWQKSYHDHIIRSEEDYHRIAKYIEENPARWEDDCYFIK